MEKSINENPSNEDQGEILQLHPVGFTKTWNLMSREQHYLTHDPCVECALNCNGICRYGAK